MTAYFDCSEAALNHLCGHDAALGAVIRALGPIHRAVVPDLFEALVNSIVGQQIATKAQQTIWKRMKDALGHITPALVDAMTREALQAFGISYRKTDYIKRAAARILNGELDLDGLALLEDAEICRRLTQLDGVGVWTAEMLMLFSMQRPDVLSYGDLALHRGLRMLYRHRQITQTLFDKYRRRYSPYGSVASLYLWAVAGGAIPSLTDPAPEKAKKAAGKAKMQ